MSVILRHAVSSGKEIHKEINWLYSGTENCKQNETIIVTASALAGTSLDTDYHAGLEQPSYL